MKNVIKNITIVLAVLLLSVSIATAASSEVKIGVLEFVKIVYLDANPVAEYRVE